MNVSALSGHSDNTRVGVLQQLNLRPIQRAPDLVTLTGTASPLLFGDDFESGNLSEWTTVSNMVTQQKDVHAGSYAARETSNGSIPTFASKTLDTPQSDLYYSLWFKIISKNSLTSAYLQRFRTTDNVAILGVFISNTGRLGYRNDISASINTAGPTVEFNSWHQLETHVDVNGSASQVEIWLDGQKIGSLSQTESLGTDPIGRVQLGDNKGTDVYDVAFDEIKVNNTFIDVVDLQSTPTVVSVPSQATPSPLTSLDITGTEPADAGTPSPGAVIDGFSGANTFWFIFAILFLLGILVLVGLVIAIQRYRR